MLSRFLRKLYRNEDGTTAVEYAVMLALILVVVISAIGAFGNQNGGLWGNTETQFTAHGFGS